MNSNQKSFKPVVAQLKTGISAQSIKRPVAPPVYRPNKTANAAQPKMANGALNRKLPAAPPVFRPPPSGSLQTKRSQSGPVAPAVYRPEAKKIVQPKTISPQLKTANSIRPITAKSNALAFSAVQMAKAEKKAHKCGAKVIAKSGADFKGDYDGIHAEINALENYLSSGGSLDDIASIEISSMPCKYCYIILEDLGILGKVQVDGDDRAFGRCQGGSYGWFRDEGSVWKAIKLKFPDMDVRAYTKSVSERRAKLKG